MESYKLKKDFKFLNVYIYIKLYKLYINYNYNYINYNYINYKIWWYSYQKAKISLP